MNQLKRKFAFIGLLLLIAPPTFGNPTAVEEHVPLGIVMTVCFAICVLVFSVNGGFFSIVKAYDKYLHYSYLSILGLLVVFILASAPFAIMFLILFIGIFHGVLMFSWGVKSLSKDRPFYLENKNPFHLFKGALGSLLPFIGMFVMFVILKGCR